MTAGVGYGLVAMICYGLADLVYKRAAAAGVPARHFLMVQAWCFAPTVTLYALITRTLVVETSALWGALTGLFLYVGLYNFVRSLESGSVTVNAPVFRLSFTVTAALAVWLLGEPLTPFKVTGLALALVAVWLLLGAEEAGEALRRASSASLMRVLVATLMVGVANLLYKVGLRDGATPETLLVAQAAVFMPLATGFGWAIDRKLGPHTMAWRHAPVAAILLAIGLLLLVEGLVSGEASVLVPIAQMSFVVTAVAGFVVLREPLTLRKGAGLLVALAVLACLARG